MNIVIPSNRPKNAKLKRINEPFKIYNHACFKMPRVCVVVLGDLARSPRMLNHVDSLLEAGKEVLLIGYGSSPAPPDLRLVTRSLKPYPSSLQRLPRLVSYALKTIWQALTLLLALPLLSPLSHLLVQTPPGVPTLPVLWFYCWCKSISLVVDFHNYSHTILAMATGPSHPLVALTKVLEGWVGARASAALCVTKAMAGDLRENWGIEASVLHDRPPHQFQPLSSSSRSDFLQRLSSTFPDLAPLTSSSTPPALLVSSTSWTEDEDFGILLSALVMYEERIEAETDSRKVMNLPDVICVITGKGPQQQHYLEKIKELGLKHVTFLTPWLEAADYPLMLASADLGVCLHTSSSGLDLPMKVSSIFITESKATFQRLLTCLAVSCQWLPCPSLHCLSSWWTGRMVSSSTTLRSWQRSPCLQSDFHHICVQLSGPTASIMYHSADSCVLVSRFPWVPRLFASPWVQEKPCAVQATRLEGKLEQGNLSCFHN